LGIKSSNEPVIVRICTKIKLPIQVKPMPREKKFFATGLLVLTILIVIFLASGITGVEFQPGTNLASTSDEIDPVPFQFPDLSTPLWYYMLMCAIWVILPVSVILFIKYPDVRKKTLQGLVYVIIYGFILFLLSRKTQDDSPEIAEIENELINTTIIDTQREAAEFISSVAEVDPNLRIILDIILLILLGLLLWFIYRRFIYQSATTTDQIKVEIERAINGIESGADLGNIIIKCYAEMSQILKDRRGIEREISMTPREFELDLQEIGLPRNAVHQLTHLFEEARYGNAQSDVETEKEAIHLLNIIAEAC
jgi:hypothetical protein